MKLEFVVVYEAVYVFWAVEPRPKANPVKLKN
jgi:hypothetical protein